MLKSSPNVNCFSIARVLWHAAMCDMRITISGRTDARKKGKEEMGKIFKFHTDVDTDQIIASQYLLFPTIEEMKSHAFESLDPEFAKKIRPGDFVVAAENFGCGSSREQAPGVLKALGVKAVLAKSFARIFYRNAINIGLPVILCKDLYDNVEEGQEMELSLTDGVAVTEGKTFSCTRLPEYMQSILDQGGLLASLNRQEEEKENGGETSWE